MTLRRCPRVATRILDIFCTVSEHDSLIGDLTEQYQSGRSSFWYWRQVLAIVFLSRISADKIAERIPSPGTSLFIVIIGVAAALTSISPLLLVAVFADILAGVALFWTCSQSQQMPSIVPRPLHIRRRPHIRTRPLIDDLKITHGRFLRF
jgi:hypothetical protein